MPLKEEVRVVNQDPAQGHEQAKTRPCIVISNDGMNTHIGLSIVVPFTRTAWFTKSGKLSPIMVEVNYPEGGLTKTSYSMSHQVRPVSHNRFSKKLGSVNPATVDKIVNLAEPSSRNIWLKTLPLQRPSEQSSSRYTSAISLSEFSHNYPLC